MSEVAIDILRVRRKLLQAHGKAAPGTSQLHDDVMEIIESIEACIESTECTLSEEYVQEVCSRPRHLCKLGVPHGSQ